MPVIEHSPLVAAPPVGVPGPDRAGRPGTRPQAWRRTILLAAGCWLGGELVGGRRALAHHGFLGQYDFSRPMYLAGRVEAAYIGHPHARLTLKVPENLRMPRDREWVRALEDAEARQTTSLLWLSERKGLVEVSLGALLTRRLIDDPDLVAQGRALEAIVYRRATRDEYRHELLAVLLALPDGRVLVSSSPAVNGR